MAERADRPQRMNIARLRASALALSCAALMTPLLWGALAPEVEPSATPRERPSEPPAPPETVAKAPRGQVYEPVPLARMTRPKPHWRSQNDEQVRANRAAAEQIRRLSDQDVVELTRSGDELERLFALNTLWFRGRRDLAETAARGDQLLLAKLETLRTAAQ